MKIRTTLILFGVFLVALLGFAALQWLGVLSSEEKKHAERFVFPSLNPLPAKTERDRITDQFGKDTETPKGPQPAKAEDFRKVVIERRRKGKPERIEFLRSDDKKWQLIFPLKARTDDAQVNNLVTDLIGLEKQKARDLGRDLARLGLDNPDTIVTLTKTKPEQDYVLSLGDTGAQTILYAMSSDSAGKPLVVTKSKLDKVFEPLATFRDKSLLSTSFGSTGVRLAGSARKPLELTKDKDWTFKEPALGDADLAATEELIRQLAAVRVERNEDFVADGPLDAAKLEQYGLAEGKAAYVYAVTQAGDPGGKAKVEKVYVGKGDESEAKRAADLRAASFVAEAWLRPVAATAAYLAREKNPPAPSHYYARREGDDAVVRIGAFILPQLKKSADELRAKALAKLDNSKVDALNVVSGGETLRIRRPDLQGAAAWDLYSDNRTKVKAQATAVQNLLDAVAKIEIRDTKAFLDDDQKIKTWFAGETIDMGLDRPQAEITIWQDALARKDGKIEASGEPALSDAAKTKPTVKLLIGRKDMKRNVVYVRREVPDQLPVTLAVPDPFIHGDASMGAQQAFARPPDGRQTISLSSLVGGGYLAFRDRTLPSYRVDQVANLRLARPGVTYLVEQTEGHNEKGELWSNWKLKEPIAGDPNSGIIEMLLPSLVSLSAEKLITDRASEKDLEEAYGLGKSPLMRIEVTTRAAASTEANAKTPPAAKPGNAYTYVIGKKLPENAKYPGHYYARLEMKPAEGAAPESNAFVFAVPLNLVQMFDLELRNTTIYPNEGTKPVSITLTWSGETADKKPLITQLTLFLTGDKWEVKSLTENGADAKAKLPRLDERKVNALLRYGPAPAIGGPSLNPFVVDRFFQHGGEVDPKFRVNPARADLPPKLVIEVKYADGKIRQVILGDTFTPDLAKYPSLLGKFHYAASPGAPGAVLLVNEAYWQPLVAGYAYFQETAKPVQ